MIVSNALTFRFNVSLSRAFACMEFPEGLGAHTICTRAAECPCAARGARDEHPHPHTLHTYTTKEALAAVAKGQTDARAIYISESSRPH